MIKKNRPSYSLFTIPPIIQVPNLQPELDKNRDFAIEKSIKLNKAVFHLINLKKLQKRKEQFDLRQLANLV